jgi:hypothetical protein
MSDDIEELRKQIVELAAQNAQLSERLKALEPQPEVKREPMEPFDLLERVTRPAVKELPTVSATGDEIAQLQQQLERIKAIRRMEQHEPWKLAMIEAVPDNLMRQIVKDNRRAAQVAATPQPERGSGWIEQAPLRSPPGVGLIDQMMAVEDKRWRAERAREFGVEPTPKPPTIKRRV